jgi:hypothetical protein
MRTRNALVAGGIVSSLLTVACLSWAAPPVGVFPDELMPSARQGKWGYVNVKREFVIAPQFDRAGPFAEGLAPVKKGELVGYIDRKGTMIIRPQFKAAGEFSSGLAGVQTEKGYGFIDRTGKLVIPDRYEAVGSFSEGRASAKKQNGKYGFINGKGKWVIPAQYDLAGPFSGGLASVKVDGKYGYVNGAGKPAIEPRFEWAGLFSDGLASVKEEGKYGFVSHGGQMAIGANFSRPLGPFSEGLAKAYSDKEKKYGYIDMKGIFKIPPEFDEGGSFYKGWAVARDDDKLVYLCSTDGKASAPTLRPGLKKVHFVSLPDGAELRITEEWRWFVATDKEQFYSTLEPRAEGPTDRDITLSPFTVYRVFFVLPGRVRLNRVVDPSTTPEVLVKFPSSK